MPVEQRKANTGVIRRNPSAAGRLAWKNCTMAFKFDNIWRQSGTAVSFFIAIHREIKSL